MEHMSRGKIAVKTSLEKVAASKRKRIDPLKDAMFWCDAGLDKDGFQKQYINKDIGYGVFASKHFTQGDFLLEYVGERITPEDAESRTRKYAQRTSKKFPRCYIYHYKYQGKSLCIDATNTSGRLCQLVNDSPISNTSCNAKMKLKVFASDYPRLCLFAIKDINVGEEIRYDYGDEEKFLFWRNKNKCTEEDTASDSTDDDPFGLGSEKCEIDEQSSDCEEDDTFINAVDLSDPLDPEYIYPSSNEDDTSSLIDMKFGPCLDLLAKSIHDSSPGTFPSAEESGLTGDYLNKSTDNVATKAGFEETETASAKRVEETETTSTKRVEETASANSVEISNSMANEEFDETETASAKRVEETETASTKRVEETETASANSVEISNSTANDLTCQVCSRTFKRKGALSTHLRSHKKTKDSEYKKPARPCPFCGIHQSRLRRHVETKHKEEPDVIEALSFPKGSKDRDRFFDQLRKDGIFKFNKKEAGQKEPQFISERKGHCDVQCSKCKGFYGSKLFYRHREACTGDSSEYPKQIKKQFLSENDNEYVTSILNRFHDDEVGYICRNDPVMLTIGKRLYQKSKRRVDKEMECRKAVMQELRLLARLYISFKGEKEHSKSVEDMFHRSNFDTLEHAIEDITKTGGKFKHGVKHSLFYLIKTSCNILKGHFSVCENDEKVHELNAFLNVYDLHADIIFSDAAYAINLSRQERLRMPEQQAEESEIVKLMQYQRGVISKFSSEFTFIGAHEYTSLRDTICSRLTMFNARRGGEPSRLKLTHFRDAVTNRWINQSDVQKLEDWEKKLFEEMLITYQPGKGNHLVPVLIPKDCVKGLEIMADEEIRQRVGVLNSNMFLFPNLAKSPDHVVGWDAANKISNEAGVSNPQKLTASKQRHRISTIYCAIDLPEADREYFYKHMGHSKNVNEGTYQYPLPILEVTKVGRHLQNIDQGTMSNPRNSVSNEESETPSSSNNDEEGLSPTCSTTGHEETDIGEIQHSPLTNSPQGATGTDKQKVRGYFKWTSEETEEIRKVFADWINIMTGSKLPRLELLLNIDQESGVPFVTQSAGVYVMVHDQNHGEASILLMDGVVVPNGFEADIKVSLVENLRVKGNEDNERCNDGPLTYEECMYNCQMEQVLQFCDCIQDYHYFFIVEPQDNLFQNGSEPVDYQRPCRTEFDYTCIQETLAAFAEYGAGDKACKQCRVRCKETRYERELSIATWPSDNFVPIVKRILSAVTDAGDVDTRRIRDDLVMVRVFFDKLSYPSIKEEYSYSTVNFISDLGGTLGLWAGFSVLSMIELFELIVLLCSNRNRKNNAVNSDQFETNDVPSVKSELPETNGVPSEK